MPRSISLKTHSKLYMDSKQVRSEMLFWRMIETYCEPWGDGALEEGLAFRGTMSTILNPDYEINYMVDENHVRVIVTEVKNGEDYRFIAQKAFDWETFRFTHLIQWLIAIADSPDRG